MSSNINTALSSTSDDSLDAAGKASLSKYSTSTSPLSNKRILKIGLAGLAVLAVLALIIGLAVGLTSNKNRNKNVTASAAVGAYADIDTYQQRRVQLQGHQVLEEHQGLQRVKKHQGLQEQQQQQQGQDHHAHELRGQ